MRQKKMCIFLTCMLAAGVLTGGFDKTNSIHVYSREDGSGTRSAFIELFEIEKWEESGGRTDNMTEEAVITNNTDVMLTSVSGDLYGIGYVSLGSLNDSVKAVKIDGAEAAADNIKSGAYAIAAPFYIVVKGEAGGLAGDFIRFIRSSEGQAVAEQNGYAAVSGEEAFETNGPVGKLVIGGSSSVAPVMEKLIEAYQRRNAAAKLVLLTSDSSTGVTGVLEGMLDIGMTSRELTDEERLSGLTSIQIAVDGIAVIVNRENPVEDISSETVKAIFSGEVECWDEKDRDR